MSESGETSFRGRTGRPPLWAVVVVLGALVVALAGAAYAAGVGSPGKTSGTAAAPLGVAAGAAGAAPQVSAGDGWVPPAAPMVGGRLQIGPFTFHLGPFGRGSGAHRITITAINGSSISLRTDDGWTRTITVTSSTTITKGGQPISLSDLKVGDQIVFREVRNSDGTYTVTAISVVVPRIGGTVTALTQDGFSLRTRDGSIWTVNVTSSTVYHLDGAAGSRSDVTVGAAVVVEGTTGSGKTMTATSVTVQPARVIGQISALGSNSFTVQTPQGKTVTVAVTNTTSYRIVGVPNPTFADLKAGMWVVAVGRPGSDGGITAVRVLAAANPGRGLHGVFGGEFRGWFWFGPGPKGGPSPTASPGAATSGA